MPYKFNVFTGTLDLVNAPDEGGEVVGPAGSTDKAIARWNGTSGTVIQDSPGTIVQDNGIIEAQGFITSRDVAQNVVVPSYKSWIAPSLIIEPTGSITIDVNGELKIV